ncbi:putative F-box protein At2g36090 [Apium graveolens]|uniref:putative F-box protein At2g36090 n=1 Tax=Apium graveolens TaxID=4045 RepID=UPI003D7B2B33
MASSSTNQGSAAATTISGLHSDIIESHILTKFDGPSLASLASTSNLLHSLCSKQSLWKHICDSTWNSVKHPLVQRTISSFPGGYRSFYSDSFPVLRASSGQGSLGCQVETTELISAVDLRYGNDPVYSKVKVTDTNASSFAGSLFYVDLIDHKENVEIPIEYEGDENILMSKLEDNLTLSWIVIDPVLKRAANVSSLRPVSLRPNCDKTGIEVTYATILWGDCCGIDTAESVECRLVAKFCCEKGNSIELRELSLCLVDMVRWRLNGEMSLRILKEAMENGERRKENGQGKEYAKNLDCRRQRVVFWLFLAIFLISLLWFA